MTPVKQAPKVAELVELPVQLGPLGLRGLPACCSYMIGFGSGDLSPRGELVGLFRLPVLPVVPA